MPRVESYGEAKVQRKPLPGARRQARETFESAGGTVAEAQATFGGVVARQGLNIYSDVSRAQAARADAIANTTMTRQLNDLEHQVLHDPQQGILTQQGLAPMQGRDAALELFDTTAGEIGKAAVTPGQQQFFEQQLVARRDSVRTRIDTYASGQLRVYDEAETNATLASAVNAAVAAATGPRAPETIADYLQMQTTILDGYAARTHMAPAAREELAAKLRTQTHVGVIQRLLDTEQDQGAQAYYEETRDQINGTERGAIEKALEAGGLRGRGQRASDQILDTTTTLEAALERVRAIDDPKLRDEVQGRVEHRWTQKAAEEREHLEQRTTDAVNIIERTGGDFRKVPQWETLPLAVRASLKAYAGNVAEGVTVRTDPGAFYLLTTMATSADPQLRKEFLQTNLVKYVDRLSIADRKQLMELQGRIRQGEAEAADKMLVNVTAQNAMVDEALVGMRLTGTPTELRENPLLAERINQFRRAVREAVGRIDARPDRAGKPATDVEVQAIVDQLRTQTGQRRTVDRRLFPDTFVPAYAFEQAQAQVDRYDQIPLGERRRIEGIMRSEAIDPTPDRVLRYFNLLLSQTRKDR